MKEKSSEFTDKVHKQRMGINDEQIKEAMKENTARELSRMPLSTNVNEPFFHILLPCNIKNPVYFSSTMKIKQQLLHVTQKKKGRLM